MSDKENKEMIAMRRRLKAAESSHWYDKDGNGIHEVEMASKPGEFRATNKTDAKKLGLVPSVTNLLSRYQNRSGIETWKRGMIYEMLWQYPELATLIIGAVRSKDEENFNKHCKEVDEIATKQAQKAADLGSAFHYLIEQELRHYALHGRKIPLVRFHKELIKITGMSLDNAMRVAGNFAAINEVILNTGIIPTSWSATDFEFSLAWNMLVTGGMGGLSNEFVFGVGGKYDLVIECRPGLAQTRNMLSLLGAANVDIGKKARLYYNNNKLFRVLIDWKTRKPVISKRTGKISFPSYPTDPAQLATYAQGASFSGKRIHFAMNCFIASDAISLDPEEKVSARSTRENVLFRVYTDEELENGLAYMNAAALMWASEEAASAYRAKKPRKPFIPFVEEEG